VDTNSRGTVMPKTAKRIALALAAFIVVAFAIFLFNQTMQIVQSARAVNVVFGNGVMWGLIFTYCILLATPLWLWFRLPKPSRHRHNSAHLQAAHRHHQQRLSC